MSRALLKLYCPELAKEAANTTNNRVDHIDRKFAVFETCPECGKRAVQVCNGCKHCIVCGWGRCE